MTEVLLKFAHISDTHLTPGDVQAFRPHHYSPRLLAFFQELRDRGIDIGSGHRASIPASAANRLMVEQLNGLPFALDFVLHTGDVMTDPDSAEEYETARDILGQIKYPIYYLRGNHDHDGGVRSLMPYVTTADGTLDYVIDVNGVRLICLDSATHGEDHGGRLSDAQLAWLEAQLHAEPDKRLLVAIHHLPITLGQQMMDFFGMSNGDAVHALLRAAVPRLQAVFYGHIHQVVDIVQDGVYYCCVQSPLGQPDLWPAIALEGTRTTTPNPGFSVVIVTRERTYVRRCAYAMPNGAQE